MGGLFALSNALKELVGLIRDFLVLVMRLSFSGVRVKPKESWIAVLNYKMKDLRNKVSLSKQIASTRLMFSHIQTIKLPPWVIQASISSIKLK